MGVRMGGRQGDRVSGLEARWAFTGRQGGVSVAPYDSLNLADHVGDDPANVTGNRRRLAGLVDVPGDQLAIVSAVHGNSVVEATRPGTVGDVDGLVTSQVGLAVVALSADCVPIALVDAQGGVVAAVHSGWRGVACNVSEAAVAAMADLGADPGRIVAALGPAICPGCYEVSEEVAVEVTMAAPRAGARTRRDTPAVDVQAGVEEQLRAAGVIDIRRESTCTFEDPNMFSFRRDGQTGRQGVVVSLSEISEGSS